MPDNLLQTLQSLIQDVIAPDVRELKVKLGAHQGQTKLQYESLQDQTKVQFQALREQIADASGKSDAQYKAFLGAIGQNKALGERVAVLEAARH